jgi:hypothetical protein
MGVKQLYFGEFSCAFKLPEDSKSIIYQIRGKMC